MNKRKTLKTLFLSFVSIIVVYIVICLTITLSNLIGMVLQNKYARKTEVGSARYTELQKGEATYEYALYSDEEIAKNPDLAVAKLYYFPAPGNVKTNYAIIAPGGGYFECDVNKVAFPCAATVNELGYSAFVLAYRYGKYSSKYAPIDDLGRAVRFITDNAESFNVEANNYLCVGYSAGGNLVGNFATKDLGYLKYNVGKPKAIALVYPWININGNIPITGNCFQESVSLVGRLIGNGYLLGSSATTEERQGVCVQNHIDGDFPPTYIIHGNNDFIVPHTYNSDVLANVLKNYGVKYEYRLCEGLNHGFGLGVGTTAEGWVAQAVDFWKNAN